MRRRGLSPGTVRLRVGLLRRWLEHVGDPWAATAADVDSWQDELGGTARTRYSRVSHLHTFYRWAQREGLTTHDPTVMVERPRTRTGLPRPIHPADLAVAIATATPALRVALLLAAGSGLRCCEIARLRWDDTHDGHARVMGKGGRERRVPLHPLARAELEQLERSSVYVLAGWHSNDRTNPGMVVSRRANAHLRGLGITATMHALRHYAATEALRAGGSLRHVQDLLGHASPATTAIYAAVASDELEPIVAGIRIPDLGSV